MRNLILIATALLTTSANAGQIGLADFVNPTIDTFTNIGIAPYPTQHTNIVRPTLTYTAVQGIIMYYDDCAGVQGCEDNGSVSGYGGVGIFDLILNQPWKKVGLLIGRSTFGREFYDKDDNLIATYEDTDFFGNHFMAWESAVGIKRVRLTAYGSIDNVHLEDAVTGETPEPASVLLLGTSGIALALLRNKRA